MALEGRYWCARGALRETTTFTLGGLSLEGVVPYLNEHNMVSTVGTITEEVVKHLICLYSAKVKIILEVEAKFPQAVPGGIVRTVEENCRTLRFEGFDLEEE
jgi:hypothetical protein